MDDGRLPIKLNDVWHACRKIQDAIFRYGYDLCADFCLYDKYHTGLVSESSFTAVLGKYRNIVGLSDFEVRELADYFRIRDGRVTYRQFCKTVCNEPVPKHCIKCVTDGLDWNDPGRLNVIPHPEDVRRLCLILIRIALVQNIPLLPFFQDYELIAESSGAVTVSHFSRVLHFMKIPLSDEEFLLLLKRYMQDGYLVNYVAFLKHIANIKGYLKENHLTDNANKIIKDFPGKLVELDLPHLPYVHGENLYKLVFANACNNTKDKESDCDVIYCIQNYVFTHRVRVCEFLQDYDPLHTGTITKNQFERALSNIGVGRHLNQRDIQRLCKRYEDPIDYNRVKWREFECEIDTVFTIKQLDKIPKEEVESPPKYLAELPRPGGINWNDASTELRDFFDEAMHRIRMLVTQRRLYLHPFFRSYDKTNNGHVTCNQAKQIFASAGIFLSNNEINAVLNRFGNELGFHYTQFLPCADPEEYAVSKLREASEISGCPKPTEEEIEIVNSEELVIKALSKAKRQVVTKSIKLTEFLQDYDRHREGQILEVDFIRGLDNASVHLDEKEVKILCNYFRSPRRGCCILYRDFIRTLDQIFIKLESSTGDNEVTCIPLLHLANLECADCTLNFDERTQCSRGLMKLARKPDEISNLKQVFQDFDRENCGSITKNQLLRALTVREMHYLVSTRELEAICKCFAIQRGLVHEFNYREFLNTLDYLFLTGQVKRNF